MFLLRLSKILRGDLCRVNFEVSNLKPFTHLVFPHFLILQNAPKQTSFDGQLMASFLVNYCDYLGFMA